MTACNESVLSPISSNSTSTLSPSKLSMRPLPHCLWATLSFNLTRRSRNQTGWIMMLRWASNS